MSAIDAKSIGEPVARYHERPLIAASWERCRALGVDSERGQDSAILSPEQLSERKAACSELTRAVESIVPSLCGAVAGSRHAVALTDHEGYVLSTWGGTEVLGSARVTNLVPGSRWTEESVGTTAIGIALATGRAAQTAGDDHFCRVRRAWTCLAVPIRNGDGRVLGVLALLGATAKPHRHTLGMLTAFGQAVENQLRLQEAASHLSLTSKYQLAIAEHISDGVVTLDSEGHITYMNSAGARILGLDRDATLGRHVSDLVDFRPAVMSVLKSGEGYVDREFMVNSKRGALHFIKTAVPIRDEQGGLTGVVDVFREIRRVRRLVHYMVGACASFTFDDIVGDAPPMREARRLAEVAARTSSNVLVLGESGTGKELFAQAIHNASPASDGPFVAVNCSAIPRELVESELFGYERGAFTGAMTSGHPGKFELASGGTLLLDEISEMSLNVQAKLLRVIQERRICRVGGSMVLPVDSRIMAATNRDLAREVSDGNFRSDLYYRLNVFTIAVPPLRDRRSDIPLLVRHFLEKVGQRLGKTDMRVSPRMMDVLVTHEWPGNVRELENVMERALVIGEGRTLDIEHLPAYLQRREAPVRPAQPGVSPGALSIREAERSAIMAALEAWGGNKSQASRALGISRNTLYCKARKLGIPLDHGENARLRCPET